MSVNLRIVVGNLAGDPEVRAVGESTVCKFRVVTSTKWRNKAGEVQERATGHNVEVWGKQAEACAKYLHKGAMVYVEGEHMENKYEAEDGSTKYFNHIKADKVQFLKTNKEQAENKPKESPAVEDDDELFD